MREENKLNPGHTQLRSKLRIIGPIILGIGILLVIAAVIDVLTDPFNGFPFAFLAFAGMPMMFVGGVMTNMAYMGAAMRYAAGETAPVGKDTFNYMAHGTRDGVRDVASAIREGFTGEPTQPNHIPCSQCNHPNDHDAMFCEACGKPMASQLVCTQCQTQNDIEASFCNHCGHALS